MKSLNNRSVKVAARRVFAAAALVLVAAAGTAQAQGPGGGAPPIVNPKGETDARRNREARLRSAELPVEAEEVNKQHLAAAIEQTKQDFKRIQVLRNELVDRLVSRQPLDYGQVAESADEIHKRASRLKTFMMKASVAEEKGEGKGEAPPEYDAAGMKSALVKLCNTIYSFTGNPMFKNPSVVGADEPAKAGRELLAIIELSENVKRNAERMAKSPK